MCVYLGKTPQVPLEPPGACGVLLIRYTLHRWVINTPRFVTVRLRPIYSPRYAKAPCGSSRSRTKRGGGFLPSSRGRRRISTSECECAVWLVLSHLLNPIIWPKQGASCQIPDPAVWLVHAGVARRPEERAEKAPGRQGRGHSGGREMGSVLAVVPCMCIGFPRAQRLWPPVCTCSFSGPLRQNCTHHIAMRNRMGGEAIAAASRREAESAAAHAVRYL